MQYLNTSGNAPYSALQQAERNPALNLMAEVPDKLVKTFYQYNGFVAVTVKDGVVVDMQPLLEEWEKWKDEQASIQTPKVFPTLEKLAAENERLQRQLTAQEMRGDFIEECLLELSETVYA